MSTVYPAIYRQGRGDTIFTRNISEFLDSSKKVSNQILAPTVNRSSSSGNNRHIGRVKVVNYYWGSPFWGSPFGGVYINNSRTTVIQNGRQDRRNDDGVSTALRIVVGLVSAVVGGFALFKIGQGINHVRDAGEELDDIHNFKSSIRGEVSQYPNHTHISQINQVAEERQKIFKHIRGNAIADLTLMVTLAVGASFALLGAIFGSAPVIITGTVLGVIAIGGMLLKWGLDSTEHKHKKCAQRIDQLVANLKGESRPVATSTQI